MVDFDKPDVLKNHSLVTGIINAVLNFESESKARFVSFIGELQQLKKELNVDDDDTAGILLEDLQERLAWVSKENYSMSEEDRDMIIEACDELRILLVASVLEDGEEIDLDDAPVSEALGGVRSAVIGETRVIMLPRFTSEEQCNQIYEGLIQLYEERHDIGSWVMDLSLIEELPVLLLANLAAYAGRLRGSGDDLHLCWLRPDVVDEQQFERLKKFFHLESRGGYYFTAGNPTDREVTAH